jgi:hypothetical protein
MQVAHKYATGRFDLSRCYPSGFFSPQAKIAKGDGVPTLGAAF